LTWRRLSAGDSSAAKTRGSRRKFVAALAKVADVEPEDGDSLVSPGRAYRIPAGKRYDLREEDSMAKGNNSRRKETKKPKKDKK
jgi:hypothetical protein